MKQQKKILILEHDDNYAQNHKKILKDEGFFILTDSKDDSLDYAGLFNRIENLIFFYNIDLVLADTSFHFDIIKVLKRVKQDFFALKIFYLTYLGEKYKKIQGKYIPDTYLSIEEILQEKAILVKEVKKLLC